MPLGNGHSAYGRYACDCGANASRVLPEVVDAGGVLTVQLRRLGSGPGLPLADIGPYEQGRQIVRTTMLSGLRDLEPEELRMPLPQGYDRPTDMYPGHPHRDHRWAMAVDLARCTGCGACVTACYAENNISVVGREQFARHRVMSWIRIDRYFAWDDPRAPVRFQPLLCQHCDAAPCESVCPVYAAAHSEEGVNMQVYNRCIGTRYCSNNCPYKVRRFNWFAGSWPKPLDWQTNPEVTVRCRGVMEKCSFCIQRIRRAEHEAKMQERSLRDGEIVPACAQTCPADAFVFGDLADPSSELSRLVARDPRAYQLLAELNTKPAVFYLKRVVNDVAQV
jgi:Fe-S-cluster-containing dehydrogenase component